MKAGLVLGAAALAAVVPIAPAAAQVTGTVVVNATDDIYRTNGGNATGLDGTDPIAIALGSATSITFTVTSNMVTVNSGGNFNDPDGVGNMNGEFNSGYGNLSSIKASTAGFLAGVIVTPASATLMDQQTGLDFTSAGMGTSFSSLSPLSSQVFFIGDGLTGDGTGTTQTFNIPASGLAKAGKTLYLGLTDACGYSGSPSCYSDNSGSFTVTYTLNGVAAPVPESATWAMTIAGFGLVGFALRRRIRASEDAFDAKIKRMTAGEIA